MAAYAIALHTRQPTIGGNVNHQRLIRLRRRITVNRHQVREAPAARDGVVIRVMGGRVHLSSRVRRTSTLPHDVRDSRHLPRHEDCETVTTARLERGPRAQQRQIRLRRDVIHRLLARRPLTVEQRRR